MRIDIFTLFPGWFGWFLEQRHVRNALELGHSIEPVDLRATTPLRAGQVDDTPYGGGAGMVIRVDVVEAALDARYGPDRAGRRVVALAPGGRQFDDALAAELAAEDELALLSGRYEGFDERVNEHLATDVVSIGPYVLAGGELAAMVVCDAVTRKLPGALGHEESALEESFSEALEGAPEYPHYTRPYDWHGHTVPEILLSGDHAQVREWRLEQSRRRARRPRLGSDCLRYHSGSARQAPGRSRLFYVRRHRQHRACPAEAGPGLPGGRPRAGPFPGRRGHPPPHPGVRGHRDQAPGHRRARDLHGAQAVLRRRRRADVPAAFAEDREDRGGVARRRAPREAVLPARARGPWRPRARAPLDRRRRGAGLRRGRDAGRRRTAAGRGRARRGDGGRGGCCSRRRGRDARRG